MGASMTCVQSEAGGQRASVQPDDTIYHEKQSRELCALHALNNLFQDRVFSKRDLDNICYKLSPDAYVNPHKSMFGLGNYDVNVIMAALQSRNLDTVWFDKRKDIDGLVMDNIEGFILNIPMDYKWGILHLPLRRKHWIIIRKVGRHYYNLDSKLDTPETLGSLDNLRCYLREQMECKDKELLLVVKPVVSTAGSWWRPPLSNDKAGATKQEDSCVDGVVQPVNAPVASSTDVKLKHRSKSHEGGVCINGVPLEKVSKDGAEQELDVEYVVDCHIVSQDSEKPKYLKKYHQDYVPIEIHRSYPKKRPHSGKLEVKEQELQQLEPNHQLAPVERTLGVPEDVPSTTADLSAPQEKVKEMNGNVSETANGGAGKDSHQSVPSVVTVKQAADAS